MKKFQNNEVIRKVEVTDKDDDDEKSNEGENNTKDNNTRKTKYFITEKLTCQQCIIYAC